MNFPAQQTTPLRVQTVMWTRLKEKVVSFDTVMYQINLKKSVFASGGAIDVSSANQKRSFDYELNFRKPLGPDGNPLKCGDMNGDGTEDECPSMPPMERKHQCQISNRCK